MGKDSGASFRGGGGVAVARHIERWFRFVIAVQKMGADVRNAIFMPIATRWCSVLQKYGVTRAHLRRCKGGFELFNELCCERHLDVEKLRKMGFENLNILVSKFNSLTN